MYQTKHIHYKSIFKQDGQSETIEYKAKGIVHIGNQVHLSFQTKDGLIDIEYDQKGIDLKHDQSHLHFDYEKEIWNQYQLPYGSVPLKTKLILFEANDERLKMKYELYDHQGLISTVYILITMIPLTIQEDI